MRAKRILVIRLGAIGDVVRTLPAVALLRDHAPDARIDWLVEERTEGVVAGRPYVDHALVFPRAELARRLASGQVARAALRATDFVRTLRAARYELVLDFHALARSALLARLSGAPVRLGYERRSSREGAHWLATHRVRLARHPVSRFDRNDALVRAVVGDRARPVTRPLEIEPAWAGSIDTALGAGAAPVVLHPGTSRGAAHKRWPTSHYVELTRTLVADGHRVLVAHGPDPEERTSAQAIAAAGGGELAPTTPEFDALAALLQRARVVVAPDSAPLHTAALLGTPVVQLLGPTDAVENAPFAGTASRRITSELACRGCRRGCAAAACMLGLEPHRVAAAVRGLLGAKRPQLRLVAGTPPR